MALNPRRRLTKLRIDEISCVRAGACPGARIVIAKADYPDRDFAGYDVSKEVVPRHKLPDIRNTAEAKQFLMFTHHGKQLRSQHRDADLDTLAGHLVEALNGDRIDKHEDTMTDPNSGHALAKLARADAPMITIAKHIVRFGSCGLSVPEFDELIRKYADHVRRDGETEAQSFARVYAGNDELALRLRQARETIKRGTVIYISEAVGPPNLDTPVWFPHDADYTEMENLEGGAAAMRQGGQYFDDDNGEEVEGPEYWDGESDEGAAYKALCAQAEALRKREPALTREQAFARVYKGPLAQAERRYKREAGQRHMRKQMGY
jgi:hypothetical protein